MIANVLTDRGDEAAPIGPAAHSKGRIGAVLGIAL